MKMSIVDRVRELSEQQTTNFRKDDNFLKLEEFYKMAVESGIAKKPEYNLPQMDTIGIAFNVHKNPQK